MMLHGIGGTGLFVHVYLPDPPQTSGYPDHHQCTITNVVKTHGTAHKKGLNGGGGRGGQTTFFVRTGAVAPATDMSIRSYQMPILTPVHPGIPDTTDRFGAAWCGYMCTCPTPSPPRITDHFGCTIPAPALSSETLLPPEHPDPPPGGTRAVREKIRPQSSEKDRPGYAVAHPGHTTERRVQYASLHIQVLIFKAFTTSTGVCPPEQPAPVRLLHESGRQSHGSIPPISGITTFILKMPQRMIQDGSNEKIPRER